MKKNNIIFIIATIVFVLLCIITFGIFSKQKSSSKPVESAFYFAESTNQTTSSPPTFQNRFSEISTASTLPPTLPANNHFETSAPVTDFPTSNTQTYNTQYNQTEAVTERVYTNEELKDKMCLITSNADTWPGDSNDNTYVPYLSVLPNGTMDYIVSAGESYDAEEEITRRFYNLSSGVKVLQDSARLIDKIDMGDNAISVVSSSSNANGELVITLSEKWKSPFLFSYSPQSYYSKGKKQFNVNDFTATSISFTFYHTASVSGNISTQGSAIVSSASWSQNPSNKTVTLTMPLLSAGKYYGYSSSYDLNGNLILTINNKPKTLYGSVIMLDAGHGGKDGGSPGPNQRLEKNVNWAITSYTKTELEKKGATVLLTRASDQYLTLNERQEIARAQKPDVFVSIHCDGSESAEAMGTSAYYFKPMSKNLAQSIHDQLVYLYRSDFYINNPDRQNKADRECAYHPFRVTRLEVCPSVLIESGFITNEEESSILIDSVNQQKIAAAIANGIERYITSY